MSYYQQLIDSAEEFRRQETTEGRREVLLKQMRVKANYYGERPYELERLSKSQREEIERIIANIDRIDHERVQQENLKLRKQCNAASEKTK